MVKAASYRNKVPRLYPRPGVVVMASVSDTGEPVVFWSYGSAALDHADRRPTLRTVLAMVPAMIVSGVFWSKVLPFCSFVLPVFFTVGSVMDQQFDNLPGEGCVPGHCTFKDLMLSPTGTDDSCGS